MAVYAIAFQLAGDDLEERTRRFSAIVRSSGVGPCWDVPAGFSMIASDLAPDALADALVSASDFDLLRDGLLVMNLSQTMGSAFRGRLGQPELLQLLALRAQG